MPIRTLFQQQQLGRQLGELRFGTTAIAKNGKTMPVKLDTFRFTTRSSRTAQSVAERFDSEFRHVVLANNQETYEILTKVDALRVVVPPGAAAIDQWMEMWSGAGCQRRCDGITEQLTQSPCKCPADIESRVRLAQDGKACKIRTRARIMLPEIDGIGVWRVASNGFNAGIELGGDVELLSAAQAQGYNLPATLWLDKRIHVKGGKTFKFVVPCLDIHKSMSDLIALTSGGAGGSIADALPALPSLALNIHASTSTQASESGESIVDVEVLDVGAPITVHAVQVQELDAPAVDMRPQPQTTGREVGGTADLQELSALQVQRDFVGLAGGRWAKFAAQTLGRSVAANEVTFTSAEVTTLLDALDSYDDRKGVGE